MQRHLRLHRREDFANLRRHGEVQRHRLLILSVIPNHLPHNRYGFVTSKQLGNAVTRNRVRRLLREAARQSHPNVRQGYDMAFIARKSIVGQSYQTVHQAVLDCLKAADLWIELPERSSST